MRAELPEQQEAIRRRLIGRWIAKQRSAEEQIDGLAATFWAFWIHLEPTLGGAAVRAVFRRAAALAAKKQPSMASLVVVASGPDLTPLRADLGGENPDRSREIVIALLDELFAVLYGLLGHALLPILNEVEAELAMNSGQRAHEEKR